MKQTYENLLADLKRSINDNEADIKEAVNHLTDLMVERQKLKDGIEGVEEELSELEAVVDDNNYH